MLNSTLQFSHLCLYRNELLGDGLYFSVQPRVAEMRRVSTAVPAANAVRAAVVCSWGGVWCWLLQVAGGDNDFNYEPQTLLIQTFACGQ